MKSTWTVFWLVGVVLTAGAYTDARVDEIVGWLPARPARIRAAEKMLADPIPDLADDMYMEFSRSGNRSR